MNVDYRTLLSTLLGGRMVFSRKPTQKEYDMLCEDYQQFIGQLPRVEDPSLSPRQLEKANKKARIDDIYRRFPKLKRLKGEIKKTGLCLKIIDKHGMMENADEYAYFCKKMIRKMDKALNGKFTIRSREFYDDFEWMELERQWKREQ